MTPQPSTIAHYRLTSKIGEGGMGAVWRATDTRLNREVAVKLLPESFAADPDRLARFEREAQVLAALNHPHIAAIYGVESGAIVMELVAGDDLKGPLPLDTAIAYAKQIALALEAAHEKGIVHRDLKPANIKVTPEGALKLLDFGLAKADTAAGAGSASVSPTLTLRATQAGVILGTAAYMSPEQARGKAVDKRADIWAFGVVFYEMLTGVNPFASGDNITDILSNVVSREPDYSVLPKDTPAHLRRLIERCLRKNPKVRLRDIGEARIALDEPAAPAGPAPAATARRSKLSWIAAAVFAATAAGSVYYALRPAEPARAIHFTLAASDRVRAPLISPDGRRLVIETPENLYLRDLDSPELKPLAGTLRGDDVFWSPDSRHIGFFADGKLKRLNLANGLVTTICEAPNNRGGTWGTHDVIVFNATGPGGALLWVPAAGGTPTPATSLGKDEDNHRWPSFLPDGRHFLFFCRRRDGNTIEVGDLNSPERWRVLDSIGSALYDPRGYLLFVRDNLLIARPWSPRTFQFTGDAFPLPARVEVRAGSSRTSMSLSNNGTLAYSEPREAVAQHTWFDRMGNALSTAGAPGAVPTSALSHDGRTLIVERGEDNTRFSLWLLDLIHGTESRFARPQGHNDTDGNGLWSPDDSHIVFNGNRPPKSGLWIKPASGGTPEEQILPWNGNVYVTDWSRDGRYILFHTISGATATDIWLIPMTGYTAGKPEPFEVKPGDERNAMFSPDGRWVAYQSDEGGTTEIYVTSFPSKAVRMQISTAGGSTPLWSRDGRELFYYSQRAVYSVPITPGDRLEHGQPRQLFKAPAAPRAVSLEGKRFLVPVPGERGKDPIHVIVNWERLRAKGGESN